MKGNSWSLLLKQYFSLFKLNLQIILTNGIVQTAFVSSTLCTFLCFIDVLEVVDK
jgi:hypothetical protein